MSIELESMFAGDTNYLTVTITDGADPPVPYDITDWVVWFVAKESKADLDVDAPIFLYTDAGITYDDAVNGSAIVAIDPADTAIYVADGITLLWDVQVLTDAGDIYTVADGTLPVLSAVTRATSSGAPLIVTEEVPLLAPLHTGSHVPVEIHRLRRLAQEQR